MTVSRLKKPIVGTFSSVRARILFWFVSLAVSPILLMFWLDYGRRGELLLESASKRISAIRELKEDELRSWMVERMGDLRTLAANDDIRSIELTDHPAKPSDRDKRCRFDDALRILRTYLRNYGAYEELLLVDTKGIVVLSTNPRMVGMDKKNDPYFTNPMKHGGIYVKNIYFSQTLQKKSMALSIPVFSKSNHYKIIGILVARLDIATSVHSIFESTEGLGKTGECLVVDSNGTLLISSAGRNSTRLPVRIDSPAVLKALRGETGVIVDKDYRGNQVVASYDYIPFLKWGVVAKQNMDEILAPLHDSMSRFAVVASALLIAVLMAALFLARAISAPILDLANNARKAGRGDFTARNTLETKDEIGLLGSVLNQMMEELEQRFTAQKQVALISRSIAGIDDHSDFADTVLKLLVESTEARVAIFYTRRGALYEPFASIGGDIKNLPPLKAGDIAGDRAVHLEKIPKELGFLREGLGLIVPKEMISFPLMIDDSASCVVMLLSSLPFSPASTMLVENARPILSASFARIEAHRKMRTLAEARDRVNKQLVLKTKEVERQTNELRRQNEVLEEQKERLRKLSKTKGEFLSSMSHELRTPLNSILALSKVILNKDGIDEETREYLIVVRRNGEKLLELINHILELSKLESENIDVRLSRFNIKTLVEDCLALLKPLADAKNISLDASFSNHCEMTSDPNLLRSVVQNLAGNAVKFTDKGGVTLDVACENERVEIKITDTGPGIPENELSTIFEEFKRVDVDDASRAPNGTGLGLAIAKKAVSLIGGSISVSSKVNVGTCFTVSIPINASPLTGKNGK